MLERLLWLCFVVATLSQFLYEKEAKGHTITSNGTTISVKLNGVPSFTVSYENGAKYSAEFKKIYQIESLENYNKKVGGSNVALPSLKWEFTEPEILGNTITFNLTAPFKKSDATLTFRIKFNSAFKSMKFDTIIENFDSTWKSKGNYLVFGYKLSIEQNSTSDNKEFVKRSNQVKFGDAVFEVKPTTESNQNVTIDLTEDDTDSSKSAVVVVYEKFSGTLIHDPTITIETPFGFTISLDRETLILLTVLFFGAVGLMSVVFLGVCSTYVYVITEGLIRDPYGRLIH
eukprot:gene11297-4108_t